MPATATHAIFAMDVYNELPNTIKQLIDKNTFIFTKDDCFESPLWLYQIEELLNEDFIRASKSTLFNMQHIKSLKADIGSRVIVYLDNGDQILVSRKYAKEFKKRLGGV